MAIFRFCFSRLSSIFHRFLCSVNLNGSPRISLFLNILKLFFFISLGIFIYFGAYEFIYERRLAIFVSETSKNRSAVNDGCVLTLWHDWHMGIGNEMFVYASLYGISKKFNLPAVVASTARFQLYDYFENHLELPYVRELQIYSPFNVFCTDEKGCEKCCSYAAENLNLLQKTCRRPTRLIYYLQSWKYFRGYENEIRRQFECVGFMKHDQKIRLLNLLHINNLRLADFTLVAVHVRRGDIVREEKLIDLGYVASKREYFIKAMRFMETTLGSKFSDTSESKKQPLFLVLGNDYTWNFDNFHDMKNVIVVDTKESTPIEDYCFMTMLEHTIFSVGTYGWWVAYVNNGVTVYDKNFALPNSMYENSFVKEDYFPPEWHGIDANS